MRATFEEHYSKLAAVKEYIEKLKETNDVVLQHPDEESAKEFKKLISMPQKRSYDYSLIIITIYGVFESFVEKIVCAYLSKLSYYIPKYDSLPELLKKNHIELSAKLIDSSSPKYRELSPKDIIANLHSCLSQTETGYHLNIDAFRQHTSNFRADSLRDFFKLSAVDRMQDHIIKDEALTSFIRSSMGDTAGSTLPPDKFFEYLEDLVERRNVVAHGSDVDDILSLDYLSDYATYIGFLMQAIMNGMFSELYAILLNTTATFELGKPIKIYDNRIVCINSFNQHIRVGDIIISKNTKGSLRFGPIKSIQINGKECKEVGVDRAVDVGLAVPFHAKDVYSYFLLSNESR